jgi:hypothetical protein
MDTPLAAPVKARPLSGTKTEEKTSPPGTPLARDLSATWGTGAGVFVSVEGNTLVAELLARPSFADVSSYSLH